MATLGRITGTLFQSTPDLVNRENTGWIMMFGVMEMFQSTPDLVNRENSKCSTSPTATKAFQSTPDLVNRENCQRQHAHAHLARFNPLPI